LKDLEDERLIEAVAGGDDRALKELLYRNVPWLASRLRGPLPASAVEDVLQETFVAVWRGARRYEARGNPRAWIWVIARNQASMWARKNGRARAVAELPEVTDAADSDSEAVQRADLDRALEGLGPEGSERRRLATLIFVEDRSVADAASIFGVPEGTIKSRLHRIRRLLRAALSRGGS
jgi:RNA polymerase sigma-70 factor (ECF subfamily)